MTHVLVYYANGSCSMHGGAWSYRQAHEFCRNNVSYSGDRVRRVVIRCYDGSIIAIWDASWNDASKAAGLRPSS